MPSTAPWFVTCNILKCQVFLFVQLTTIILLKNNVKIYFNIYTKSAPTCFGLDNHHQRACRLCFAKVIIVS